MKRQVCTITRQPLFCTPLNTATVVPMSYKDVRLGYGKEKLKKYPNREVFLFSVLTFGLPTIKNKESEYQDLTFNRLKMYYVLKHGFK